VLVGVVLIAVVGIMIFLFTGGQIPGMPKP